ncbi:hypothetical protein KQ944_07805 [Bacillus subtilis]|uniref:hypothetical protein n=1 Tax=Pseudochrobactrum asaccharolyticum TaxID=354351 RepID=UPI001F45680D|nr:hypothetical protein [Pseudochrobactrum asaccharolyticum]MCF7645046.1 hypothetical protein [Pseudochrobactrum asaccharolyticum]MCF7671527.1 hypothetical protein [Bacillus subtilis]
MDKTVPAGAAILLDFIRKIEAGRTDRASYDVIYGKNQHKLKKQITAMTIGELVDEQVSFTKRFKSSASGGYQFMRKTLQDLSRELRLSGKQMFDPDLQDRLGYHLLKRRGYEEFMAGKITMTEFAKRLAMEWASFPVLAATKGQHQQLKRGQSYYDGDALNKALVKPEDIEVILRKAKAAGNELPALAPKKLEAESLPPEPEKPKPVWKSKRAWLWSYIGTMSPAALMGAFDWRVQMVIVLSIIGISIYSILTMKQVKDKIIELVEAL